MMRNSTDVKVTENVNISRALYNNKAHRERAISAARVMQRTLDTLRQHLDLPVDIAVRVCTFRKVTRFGCYNNSKKTAAVCLRIYRDMIKSLAHELVHAEQYHQGRLSNRGSTFLWNSEPIKTTRNAYRNQPWEIEARAHQYRLASIVLENLGINL